MRFGRKSGTAGDQGTSESQDPAPAEGRVSPVGPFDVSDVDVETLQCLDLGSLLVAPVGDMELQLQVEQDTGQVMAVLLIAEHGALELRAFSASRGGSAWDELRPRIAAELARLGGTCDEQQGSFGVELMCRAPAQGPDGQPATQATRIVAHEGPAWLLRATLMGPAAVDKKLAQAFEETIRQVVVRRGREAMPPGAPLPLKLPADAHPHPVAGDEPPG